MTRSGVSSGDGSRDKAVWMEAFHTWSDQDSRANELGTSVAGYDANVTGVAIGGDAKVGNDMRVGASLSYSDADVDGEDAGLSRSDSETWTISLYGTKMMEQFYVNGLLSYGSSDTDTQRSITQLATNYTIKGGYNSDIYNLMVGAGMPQMVGDISLIPNVGMQWTYMDPDSYTESGGATGLNLTIDPDDQTIFIIRAGLDVADEIKVEGGTLVPELKLGVSYDIASDDPETRQTPSNVKTWTTQKGAEVAELGFNLGAGLSFTNQDGSTTFGVSYSGEWKDDYDSHTAMGNVRFNF